MKDNIVIITPAFNEEVNLDRLSNSILSQKLLPQLWIIVNDESSDSTGKMIDELSEKYDFIHAVHNKKSLGKFNYYAHKIHAFNKGYEYLKGLNLDYSFVSNLDADMSLPPNYYSDIINEFTSNPKLGIAGGSYRYSDNQTKVIWGGNYVPGSILMARRECFEQIGGYKPLKFGAEDTLLCIEAEVNGWNVEYFPQYQVVQHRIVGTTGGFGILNARYRQGLSEYSIGYHPLFSFIKFLKRAFEEKPYIIGSIARYSGYLLGPFYNCRENISSEAIKYFRNKQLSRSLKLK